MKKRKKNLSIVLGSIFIIALLLYISEAIEKSDKECVGYQLGSDDIHPIVVCDELYFPIAESEYPYGEDWNKESCMELYGNIKTQHLYDKRGEIKNPLEYLGYVVLKQVWVDKRYDKLDYLKDEGAYHANYLKAERMEDERRTQQLLEDYSSFMLLNRYNTSGDKYICPEELIVELEQEFGECIYNVNDFDEMKETYYICVNTFFQYDTPKAYDRHYIATIFVDEQGNFYYCNSDNLINDEMSQKLKKIFEERNIIGKEYYTIR